MAIEIPVKDTDPNCPYCGHRCIRAYKVVDEYVSDYFYYVCDYCGRQYDWATEMNLNSFDFDY